MEKIFDKLFAKTAVDQLTFRQQLLKGTICLIKQLCLKLPEKDSYSADKLRFSAALHLQCGPNPKL
jgi:hypothetical protein